MKNVKVPHSDTMNESMAYFQIRILLNHGIFFPLLHPIPTHPPTNTYHPPFVFGDEDGKGVGAYR